MLEDRVMLKEDRVFVVSDLYGDVQQETQLGLGLYRSDTRFLSRFELRLNGTRPILLNHSLDRGYIATFQLVNPRTAYGDSVIPMQTLSLRRTRFLRDGLHERIGLQNCAHDEVDVELELRFAADFIDIFEVRGFEASGLPAPRPVSVSNRDRGLCFEYRGEDGVMRRTEVVAAPKPEYDGETGRLRVHLRPQETFVLNVDVIPRLDGEDGASDFSFDRSLEGLERRYRDWKTASTRYDTDNEQLDRGLLWRSHEDLRILCDELPTGLFPTAGIPWYAVPFGRDALITSLQTIALNPELARGTLRFLAEHQGTGFDEFREEQPGRILHEIRFGELANLGQVPHTPFYGTCDATALFVVLLVELVEWNGDVELLRELLPNAMAALEWMDRYGDLDGDGFIEYTHHALGVRNQNWKDSSDSLTEETGEMPRSPIAPVEVQAYAYRAKSGLSRLLRAIGEIDNADRLESQARELRRRFHHAFWMPEDRFYAQALNGSKEQVRAISSNVGHALWAGIVDDSRAPDIVARLMAPDMFSGWGIRTLSTRAVSYNPMSYHNGSVWPHDNSLIAAGLRRYGFQAQAEVVARSILEAGMRFSGDRLPELFCGFARDRRFNSGPVEYLVSCIPQAWAAGAAFHFLHTLTGLTVDALERRIVIDPMPTTLYRRLRVEGMRAAGGELDFTVEQDVHGLRVDVDRAPAGVDVRVPA